MNTEKREISSNHSNARRLQEKGGCWAWEDSSFKYKEEGQSGAEKNMDK